MKTFDELVDEGKIRETYLGYRSADLRHKWAICVVEPEHDEEYGIYFERWYVSDLEYEGKPALVESCIDEHALIFSKREAEAYLAEHDLARHGFEVVELYAVLRS